MAGFIGSSNFLEATLVGVDRASDKATVETAEGLRLTGPVMDPAADLAKGRSLVVAIRPERFRIGPGRSAGDTQGGADGAGWVSVPGRVTQGTYLGDQTEYRVDAAGLGELVIRRQNEPTSAASNVDRIYGPGEAVGS